MTTEKYTFDDLTVEKSLRNNFYIVPDYQREYVWEADKVPAYAACNFYLTSSLHHLDEIGVNTAITRINKYLQPFDHWDAETIAQRQELLYNLSLEIWKVE